MDLLLRIDDGFLRMRLEGQFTQQIKIEFFIIRMARPFFLN